METFDVSLHYCVYILFSFHDKGLYIGYSTDLKDRLQRHARGEVSSTKHRRPLKLIYFECFVNKDDAKAREVFLKSGFGRTNLYKSLQRTLVQLR